MKQTELTLLESLRVTAIWAACASAKNQLAPWFFPRKFTNSHVGVLSTCLQGCDKDPANMSVEEYELCAACEDKVKAARAALGMHEYPVHVTADWAHERAVAVASKKQGKRS